MPTKIGLMVGREWSFPPALEDEVRRQDSDLQVEYIKLATPRTTDTLEHAVILDRISHAVPFYRSYLKHAALRGVRVINDPFVEATDDRFLAATVADQLGIQTPRTVVLPHREYADGIIHEESLRNLDYPLDWQAVLDHVGAPCILKDAHGSGDPICVCHSVEELLEKYNASGERLLIVQQSIAWEKFVRCFVIGDEVLALRFEPREGRYAVDHEHLTPALGERLVSDSLRVTRGLGYEINAVDWAIQGEEPYAVELVNPVPDIDIYALTSHYFERVVSETARLLVAAVGEGVEAGWRRGGRLRKQPEGASDLAEELPSLARGLPHSDLQP